MNTTNNQALTKYAQKLRRGMTPEERKLWNLFLRKLNVTINRQKVFGVYILDFYCSAAKVAIEIDGSQHYNDSNSKKDLERDSYLNAMGIKVLRYTNREINRSFDVVCKSILNELSKNVQVHFKE